MDYNILDYGAVPDGQTNCHEAIQHIELHLESETVLINGADEVENCRDARIRINQVD